jgi:hypothetical protein
MLQNRLNLMYGGVSKLGCICLKLSILKSCTKQSLQTTDGLLHAKRGIL